MATQRAKAAAQKKQVESERDRQITQDLRWLMEHVLTHTDSLTPPPPPHPVGPLQRGYHCHSTWEFFCPLKGELTFRFLGEPPQTWPAGKILLVPPDKPHKRIKEIHQSPPARILSFSCAVADDTFWVLATQEGNQRYPAILHPEQLPSWTERIGMKPEVLLERVAQAVGMGVWGRESALGLLRHLFATFMQAIDEMTAFSRNLGRTERLVASAMLQLQTRYYSASLNLQSVAMELGISLSHLHRLFRAGTGKTLHQMLTEIRMRRAEELLKSSAYSIKEVAYLTGWKNQLYFSTAFHKHHGESPSSFRERNATAES